VKREGNGVADAEQQADFLARAPKTFIPAAGAWGRGGSTMIELKSADTDSVVKR
jgi:hypothetical protein